MTQPFKIQPGTYITLTHHNPSTPAPRPESGSGSESGPVLDRLEHLETKVDEYYITVECLIKKQEVLLSRAIEFALDWDASGRRTICLGCPKFNEELSGYTCAYGDPEVEAKYQYFRVEEHRIRMLLWDQTVRMYDEVGHLLPPNAHPGSTENLDAVHAAYPARALSLASRYIQCVRYLKQHLYHCQNSVYEVLSTIFMNRQGFDLVTYIEAHTHMGERNSDRDPVDGNTHFRYKLYGLIRRAGWDDTVPSSLWESVGRDSITVQAEANRQL